MTVQNIAVTVIIIVTANQSVKKVDPWSNLLPPRVVQRHWTTLMQECKKKVKKENCLKC